MDVIVVPVLQVLRIALDIYFFIVIVNVILSWLVAFNVINTSNQFVYLVGDFCHRATAPVLDPIRRFLPNLGGLDISPIILILAIYLIDGVLVQLLIRFKQGGF